MNRVKTHVALLSNPAAYKESLLNQSPDITFDGTGQVISFILCIEVLLLHL